jgi:hypothetical protein
MRIDRRIEVLATDPLFVLLFICITSLLCYYLNDFHALFLIRYATASNPAIANIAPNPGSPFVSGFVASFFVEVVTGVFVSVIVDLEVTDVIVPDTGCASIPVGVALGAITRPAGLELLPPLGRLHVTFIDAVLLVRPLSSIAITLIVCIPWLRVTVLFHDVVPVASIQAPEPTLT